MPSTAALWFRSAARVARGVGVLVGEGRGEVEAPPSRSFKAGRKGMGGFCSAAFARARVWMRDPDTALLLMCGPEKELWKCYCSIDSSPPPPPPNPRRPAAPTVNMRAPEAVEALREYPF